MADKSSTSNTENYLERAFNNTSGAAIPAAAKDSTKKFKDIHRHKRQKAMNWQGLREWQAASTRSNNLIVGTDGIVRPVSGGVVASNGSSSKGDGGGSGDNNDSTGTGTGTGTDTDTGGEKLDPFTGSTRHSSLLPKSELIPSTRSAQKRKIDWSEEDPDNAVADDIIGLTASDIPIVTSTRNRGSFNARSNTTIAQRSNRTNSYANVHPSRIGNLDPGRARPYTNGEQEELQHRFLKNESTACEELKGKVTDDISSVDLGNYAPSLAFSGSEYNSTYEEHGHSPNSNLADITAREASLCRREVLLDISEQSVMNTRTQILQVS